MTDVACSCGFLQQAADDARLPIVFDPQTAEFQFRYGEVGAAGASTLIIFHCPFCGGAAPASKRHLLFAVISREEEERLAELLSRVTSIRGALKRLGQPSRDDPSGMRTMSDETEGRPPAMSHHRTLVYEGLSATADVWITERSDGKASWRLQGKYIGPPQSGDGG